MSTDEIGTLINQGRTQEVWQRFCGFLDLTLAEFMAMQERLLHEQLQIIGKSQLGHILMGDRIPASVEEFRRRVRLTTYEDYEPYFKDKREDILPEAPAVWARTSGRSGQYKWVPYTARQFKQLGEGMLTACILASSHERGDVTLRPGDTLVYNAPARPYASGFGLYSLAEQFDFRFLPPIEKTEEMSFEERTAVSYKMALRYGVNLVGSISSVLMKIAESFARGANSGGFNPQMLHPSVLWRVGRGMIRSKTQHRSLLPRDLWHVKGILVGGTDTDIYRDRLTNYWGCAPHEMYICTEAGNIIAGAIWTHREMYFLPHTCFYEFIPEEEWAKTRSDPNYLPATVLIDEVQLGKRYELVITNFYGGPFLRYRNHDLVRFVSLQDPKNGIKLPAIVFDSRDSDVIDLAGFTGIIDEALMWHTLEDTHLPYQEWFVRKEMMDTGHAGLHLYIELTEPVKDDDIAKRISDQLESKNQFYRDLVTMLGYMPVRVTQLPRGTFGRYVMKQREIGVDLAHWKPRHMNAPDIVRDAILGIAEERS
jgi:phenylacetate-coenzyme A ligase PaaK-like adenylate-forming protein